MISTGDQRDVAQYIVHPWLMTYVNARTISTAHRSSIARLQSIPTFALNTQHITTNKLVPPTESTVHVLK